MRISSACLSAGLACMLLARPASAQIPDVADIAVAQIDDLGTPFDLKAHLYRPAGASDGPLVLYIHGKGGSYNDPRDQVFKRVLAGMLSHGIAVARMDYRRSGRMPQMLMDTKAYIRFFRAHAREYHLDPHRFGIWGVSRGGNLAAILAVAANRWSMGRRSPIGIAEIHHFDHDPYGVFRFRKH